MPLETRVRTESWPIAGGFRIARGFRDVAEVIVVELRDGSVVGRSECVPYARYDETVDSVRSSIATVLDRAEGIPSRSWVQRSMPAGAARNAIDCALWDLEAHHEEIPVWRLLGLANEPGECKTMRTVSIDTPAAMAAAATALTGASTLKVKVGGEADLARLEAVHHAAPEAAIVVDANESWTERQLESWLPELPKLGVAVLEQPLAAGRDEALADMRGPVPFCADESFHDRNSFDDVVGRYDMVNVKLDKTGGLTEAVSVVREARDRGLEFMVGCMVSTSLAIAPALLLTANARFVDLDGPLLLERDRDGAAHDAAASLLRSSSVLWGA